MRPICFIFLVFFASKIYSLPKIVSTARENDGFYVVDESGKRYPSTLVPEIQEGLEGFLAGRGNPISSLVMIEVASGKILAFVEGRPHQEYGLSAHAAAFGDLPAASLFKIISASAAIELARIDPNQSFGLASGCRNVKASAVWLEDASNHRREMTLKRAFGKSCNDFFAKIGINQVGLHTLTIFAEKFGFNRVIPADFQIPPSPMVAPAVNSASVLSVGRFAAGFGRVGISAAHAAWLSLILARNGQAVPLTLLKNSASPSTDIPEQVISPASAEIMRSMLDATTQGGTASFAFRRGKHRFLQTLVGGKTGTLSSKSPKGVATWFSGMMPLDQPEVVVGAVVLLEDLWHIKGPNLAAEAFYLYDAYKRVKESNVISSAH